MRDKEFCKGCEKGTDKVCKRSLFKRQCGDFTVDDLFECMETIKAQSINPSYVLMNPRIWEMLKDELRN